MHTKIINISSCRQKNEAEIKSAADVILHGGLVVFPTETVYGIGADATNEEAVTRIYEAKGRPSDNPLIIHVSSPEQAEAYTHTTPMYYKLAELFMPGPLTVILKSKDTVPLRTRGGLDTVAVRCPSHPIARQLISAAGVPIAAPSANLSGSPSPTTAAHVISDMLGRVDVIIDGGDAEFGLESTIVKIEDDDTLTLLRPGKITVEQLLAAANEVKIADAVTEILADSEKALSPGMKYRHYAPKASLVLLDGSYEDIYSFVSSLPQDEKTAIIIYTEYISDLKKMRPDITYYDFGEEDNQGAQAHRLFSLLRDTDKDSFSVIYAPLPSKEGIGLALYNRMIRAAAHKIIRLRR
ncbi:MAG: threonylcarbamoyl-AMP synthase [Clostridia bacterium]|nr:threonylcarbamoyl-AMP synthase [Clostridia bacterium]